MESYGLSKDGRGPLIVLRGKTCLSPVQIAQLVDFDGLARKCFESPAVFAKKCMRIGWFGFAPQHGGSRYRHHRAVMKEQRLQILSAMNAARMQRHDAILFKL